MPESVVTVPRPVRAGRSDRTMLGALSQPNGLTAVRLVLALAVLVSHSFALTGRVEPQAGAMHLGTYAVIGFFAVSGYLVTGSRLTLSAARFAWHRGLRVYPGFWVCLGVVGFVLAPLQSRLAGEHWTPRESMDFVLGDRTTVITVQSIGATLLRAPVGPGHGLAGVWDLPLWTLRFEIVCYVVIGALLTIPLLRRPYAAAGLLAVAVAGQFLGLAVVPTTLCRLGAPFAAGALLRLLGERVRLDRRWVAAAVAGAAICVVAHQQYTLGALPIAFLVLWAGTFRVPPQRLDLSFGVYIYAWPIQQILASNGIATANIVGFTALVTVIVLPMAWLSWTLVERPAQRLRSFRPLHRQ